MRRQIPANTPAIHRASATNLQTLQKNTFWTLYFRSFWPPFVSVGICVLPSGRREFVAHLRPKAQPKHGICCGIHPPAVTDRWARKNPAKYPSRVPTLAVSTLRRCQEHALLSLCPSLLNIIYGSCTTMSCFIPRPQDIQAIHHDLAGWRHNIIESSCMGRLLVLRHDTVHLPLKHHTHHDPENIAHAFYTRNCDPNSRPSCKKECFYILCICHTKSKNREYDVQLWEYVDVLSRACIQVLYFACVHRYMQRMNLSMYVYMYMYMYVCMQVCMYTEQDHPNFYHVSAHMIDVHTSMNHGPWDFAYQVVHTY